MLELHNPHSIIAALKTRPGDVSRINLPVSFREAGQGSSSDDAWTRVVSLAKEQGVPVQVGGPTGVSPVKPRQPRQAEGGRASSISALLKPRESTPLETLFLGATERKGGRGLWLALDSLQDPHNIGAVFRTAAFFGVEGIVVTEERSAPLSATAYDVASGGIEHVPFTQQINLQRAFEKAKEAGLWILGASEHASDDLRSIARDRPWLLVLGNEEKGMRRLTEEACDVLCKISPQGSVTSLNVSVAAGILVASLSR